MTNRRFSPFIAACVVMLLTFIAAPEAHALRVPRPLATDGRIQTVMYSPNEVYKFTGHYGYQSSIELAPDETISTISVGDSLAWSVSPSGSRIFLKPVEQDALTNMTVITDKRVYHFELHPKESEEIDAKDMVFVLRFQYPEDEGGLTTAGFRDAAPNPEDPDERKKYNFNYTLSGSDVVAPLRVFDDGQFTYFEFRDKNGELPAFFAVDPVGDESLINFRTRGNYIVVERVASVFTLRSGGNVVCVFNESLPLKKKAEKSALSKMFGK